jgi:L,D-transpeptidase ErfK/SrfK
MVKIGQNVFIPVVLLIIFKLCYPMDKEFLISSNFKNHKTLTYPTLPINIKVHQGVMIENYFEFIDSLVRKYDSLTPYTLTEHLLVRSNKWIIDTLQNTDYYRMKARDSFVYNQKKMVVLPKGASITIPDSQTASKILSSFKKTFLDINIPEFNLRIYEDSLELYSFPIRVGRNEKKYLKMSGRIQNLKTKTGDGTIVNHVRNPRYVNPVNNHQYFVTRRDDDKVTKLPQIPFIETEIDGVRNGQLIHPTTNPITLGKAYSNGCIGTDESAAWVIYYYAPIHTKIKIRYDLNAIKKTGESTILEDIYNTVK